MSEVKQSKQLNKRKNVNIQINVYLHKDREVVNILNVKVCRNVTEFHLRSEKRTLFNKTGSWQDGWGVEQEQTKQRNSRQLRKVCVKSRQNNYPKTSPVGEISGLSCHHSLSQGRKLPDSVISWSSSSSLLHSSPLLNHIWQCCDMKSLFEACTNKAFVLYHRRFIGTGKYLINWFRFKPHYSTTNHCLIRSSIN